MLKLYQRTDCPFCWKVRLALSELDVDYRSVDLELGERHPEVERLSPTGTVPRLVDGDVAIWESSVALDYLDRRYAKGRLIPTDPAAEARMRLLHAYSDKVIGRCLSAIGFEKRSKPERGWDTDLLHGAESKWRGCLDWLESRVGTEILPGDRLSAAACALAARLGVAEAYGVGVTPEHPGLHHWFRETCSRRSWKEAYPYSFIRAA